MKSSPVTGSSSSARLGALALLAAAAISSCGGGSPAPLQAVNVNQLTAQPDTSIGSQYFIGQEHFGGDASNLAVKGLHWGRLVNIRDKGSAIVMRDFIISGAIRDGSTFSPSVGSLITYHLDRNPVTDQFSLRIGAPQNTNQEADEVTAGSQRFREALANLEANLTPIFDRGVEPDEVGPFSMVPRNAAMVMTFNDLLEPVFDSGAWNDQNSGNVANPTTGQLHKSLLRIRTGYPPVTPFEARLFLDPNHGNIIDRDNDGTPEFYSTRVIISPTVSSTDSVISNPPLAINSTGLPESLVPDDSNVALRVPTLPVAGLGQPQVLRNASGRGISYFGNGSTDNATGTQDIVRALRSGGGLTQDPNNGFLLDENAPSLLGDLSLTIGSPVDYVGCDDCTKLDLDFDVDVCESVKVNDLLTQSVPGGLVTGIVRGWDSSGVLITDASLIGDTLINVVVETITAPAGQAYGSGAGRLGTRYEEGDNSACFVRFSPPPLIAPNVGVSPAATAFLLFSEPMDPGSVKAFDSFTVTYTDTDPPAIPEGYQYAVGLVAGTANLRTFSWQHAGLPFNHVNGSTESYTVTVGVGDDGPKDLAGNPLAADFEPFFFLLDANAATDRISGFAMRFEDPGDSLFDDDEGEIRDAHVIYDPENERMLPRPVSRITATADNSQLLPGLMSPVPGGVQTPLSNLGSKLHTVWRDTDVGFAVADETNYNMDVEGISWAPVAGNVASDVYQNFQISLTHSDWVPDEILDTTPLPKHPTSGLLTTFASNPNDVANDPFRVVHPKSRGYVVSSGGIYQADTGTTMLPFPLNVGLAPEDYQYYTWRDTALLALGGGIPGIGSTGSGVPVTLERDLNGVALEYALGVVPTVGLPLLMEFRCYSSDEALGLNSFDVAFTQSLSPQPNFRVFSTGGYVGTLATPVDPDNEDSASGGYNPLSTPPGASTPPGDSTFYFGELALVTRVSRAHSVWFDTGAGYTRYAQPFLEPEQSQQPSGTSIQLAFRGAVAAPEAGIVVSPTQTGAQGSSGNLTPYGDNDIGANPSFFEGNTWRSNISQIDTARWFQFRLTFVANAATDRTPELRTLAFAYYKTDPGQ